MAQQAYFVIENLIKKVKAHEATIHFVQVWAHIDIYWLLNRWFFKRPAELETIKEWAALLTERSQPNTVSWTWNRQEIQMIFAGAEIPYPAAPASEEKHEISVYTEPTTWGSSNSSAEGEALDSAGRDCETVEPSRNGGTPDRSMPGEVPTPDGGPHVALGCPVSGDSNRGR